jgi:TolB protein
MLTDSGFDDLDPHNLWPLCPDSASWAPNGESLAFVFPCYSLWPIGLWKVDEIGGAPSLLAGPISDVTGVAWSPDGSQIAFSHTSIQTLQPELTLISPDGERPITVTLGGVGPIWSPDGTRLAFWTPSEDGASIVVRDSDGELREVATIVGSLNALRLAWSPDGENLAYTSPGVPGIFVVDAVHEVGTATMIHPDAVTDFDWR